MRSRSTERRGAGGRPPAARVLPAAILLLGGLEIAQVGPETALWAAPAILLAAMMIAWAAESAQFFIAQGFALAILAWLQTLPEFAVEFVFAWKQQVPLLIANLTGSLRLLTGLAWPMIYFVAALFHRRTHGRPLRSIRLADHHCVEVIGLFAPLVYAVLIWWKGSLNLLDAVVLIAMYAAYLLVLGKMPPEQAEGIEDLELIPRSIVQARPRIRTAVIAGLFLLGGALIYYCAEPFAGSLLAISASLGVPAFVFVQWVAPFVSEFPEKVSAFYWARTVKKAPMALMNMVSSNINQWTMLAAMLPIVFSISRGAPSAIVFDQHQELEMLMTIAQSGVGMLFLVNMELAWWEAGTLFSLWFVQFVLSPVKPGPNWVGFLAGHIHWWVTVAYLVWVALGILRMALGQRQPSAFRLFAVMWRCHVRRAAASPAAKRTAAD